MRNATIIVLSLLFGAIAFTRLQQNKPALFQGFKGWKKLIPLIGVILTLLILLNPDLLALGLLGDTAFFDILALALSVQMIGFVRGAVNYLNIGFFKGLRWLGIPSPGLRYSMYASAVAITGAIAMIQKIAHRISS